MELLQISSNLIELELSSCQIQGKLTLAQNSLPQVTKIMMVPSQITAANLMELLQISFNLTTLHLSNGEIEGELIFEPNKLPEITSITLCYNTITANNLIQLLLAAPNVTILNLEGCNIQGELIFLPNILSEVTSVTLHNATITVCSFNQLLSATPNVRTLSICGCEIPEELTLKLNSLLKVSEIQLTNTTITATKLIQLLLAAPNVIELALTCCNIKGELTFAQNSLPKVTKIHLSNMAITAASFMQLLQAVPNVRELYLRLTTIPGELTLEPNSLLELINISLEDATITNSRCYSNLLSAASNVVRLKLISNDNIIDELTKTINFSLPNLYYVELKDELIHNEEITSCLSTIAKNLHQVFGSKNDIMFNPGLINNPETAISNTSTADYRTVIYSNPGAINNPINNTEDSNTEFTKGKEMQAHTGSIILIAGQPIFQHAREHVYNIIPQLDGIIIAKKEIQAVHFHTCNITPIILNDEQDLTKPLTLIDEQEPSFSLYQAKQILKLTANKKYKLISMTPNDQLINLQIILADPNIIPLLTIEYCTDNNFYYVNANKACTITAFLYIKVITQSIFTPPDKISELIKELKSFTTPDSTSTNSFALTGITDQSSGVEQVEAMYAQKKGSCRHRVAVFLYQLNKIKSQCHSLNDITARGAKNTLHSWIEISYDDGKTWNIENLGGYPAKRNVIKTTQSRPSTQIQDTYIAEQTLPPFANVRTTTIYSNIQDFLQNIKPTEPGKRILLEMQTVSILEKMRKLLLLYFTTEQIDILSIDQYTDLQSSNPSVSVTNLQQQSWDIKTFGGRLSDFLNSQSTNLKVLLIDWSKLTASDMVSVNGLIDDHHRQVDTVDVPDDITIIGLITPPQNPGEANFLEDPSFTSRHDQIIKIPFTAHELDAEHKDIAPEDTKAPMVINLYNSSNWQNLLFGQCTINNGVREWQKGQLIIALEQELPIVINNGPWNDYLFERCMFDLTVTGNVTCYNKIISSQQHPLVISRIAEYNFIELSQQIDKIMFNVTTNNCSLINYLVNSATLERCFINEKVEIATGQLVRTPGWLQMHQKQSIALLITDNLNLQQWTYLLEVAKQHKVKINLNLAPNVSAPTELLQYIQSDQKINKQTTAEPEAILTTTHSLATLFSANSKQQCYYLTTAEPKCLAIALQQLETDALVLDISELNDEDLLYSNNFVINNEHNNGHQFKFTEKISPIWKMLSEASNAKIILTGTFSKEIISHLGSLFLPSGYLWHQGKQVKFKGRLILITEPKSDCDFIAPQQEFIITPALKQQTILTAIELNNDNGLQELTKIFKINDDLNQLFNQPYSNILQAIKYANAILEKNQINISINDALLCRYIIPAIEEQEDLDLSITASENFKQQRCEAVDCMLGFSPYCVLESVTGTGKTSFIKEYSGITHELFLLDQIEQWITTKCENNSKKILFIDEANLVNTDWTQFSGLFNQPATVLINGVIHQVPAACKIIFAQNPINYGNGREIPSLFVQHPSVIVFPPMPAAYIYQNILLPILILKFAEADCEFIARYIFKKYDLSSFKEPEKHGLTVRVLQAEALKYCATAEAANDIIANLKKQESPQQVFHVVMQNAPTDISAEYIMTSSRYEVDAHLQDIIQIQRFRHNLAARNPQATPALYGGQNALLLEGPPGVGKSELIKYLLTKYKFTEIKDGATEQPQPGTGYYFIPASMNISLKLKLLEQAFQQGNLVVCEEINSNQVLEKNINAYLMGDDLKITRPAHPGFALIGTYNSASLRGRRLLSPALRSRAINCTLPEYTEKELLEILNIKYRESTLQKNFLQFVIKQFLIQQNQAIKDKSLPMPNLRDLLRVINQYLYIPAATKDQQPPITWLQQKCINDSLETATQEDVINPHGPFLNPVINKPRI